MQCPALLGYFQGLDLAARDVLFSTMIVLPTQPTEIMCEHRILQHTGLIRRHECGKRKKKAIKMFVFNDVVMLAKLKQDKKG